LSGGWGVVCSIGLIASAGYSDLIDIYGGHYDAWPTAWNAVSSLNDPNDGVASELDFVGDSSDPCFYYHVGSQYIYFRCRVADGAADADTYRDSVLVTIDQVGVGNVGEPDYAFAWDSKGEQTNPGQHGLEMTVLDSIVSTWDKTKFDDIDGNAAQKIAPPDIGLANGDGYLRLNNNQSTANFGLTTYIDFAVSWDYLENKSGTTLAKGQEWRLQLGSIANATDHNNITEDVAGSYSPGSTVSLTWSGPISTVPEPSCIGLMMLGAVVLVRRYKHL
jgi:hypothetical protein